MVPPRTLVPVPCDDDGILPSKLAPLLPGAKVLCCGCNQKLQGFRSHRHP